MAGYVEKRGCSKSKIIPLPNSVDTDLFSPGRPGSEKDRRSNVIYAGRLSNEKNLSLLLQAVSVIKSKSMDIKLICIGEGKEKDRLLRYATLKKIDIEFTGVIAHEKMPCYLRRSNLFVLPSLTEGHPKTLLEAMSCGLPCIGNNIPGINETIEDGFNGLLFDGSLTDLTAKIELLLSDKQYAEKLGNNARKTILESYDKKKIIDKEIGILKGL